jgi:hypothetical protein
VKGSFDAWIKALILETKKLFLTNDTCRKTRRLSNVREVGNQWKVFAVPKGNLFDVVAE